MKKATLRIASLLCALLVLVAAMPSTVQAARGLQDVQADIDAKKEELKQLEANIEANKSNQAAAEAALAQYKAEFDNLLVLIDEQEEVITNTEGDLDAKVQELNDTRASIKENKALFEQRLVAIYDINSTGMVISALLSVNSFSELVQASDAIKRISKRDTELLAALAEEKKMYQNQKKELEATIDTLTEELAKLQENRDWCYAKMEEMNQSIANAQWQINQNLAQSQQTEEEIEALEKEYAAIFAALQQKGSKKGDGSVRYNGPLLWPVPNHGRISSYYGDPRSNTRGHYGIDIPASEYTPIVASAPGVVITSEWHWSYGWYIVIDHGDGLRTLYAHCIELYKGVGAGVAKGETIAGVGNTGNSFGAHLHFEVHDNGGRQNPLASGYLA